MKRKLKKKKAREKEGWRYEFIHWAGEDLEKKHTTVSDTG